MEQKELKQSIDKKMKENEGRCREFLKRRLEYFQQNLGSKVINPWTLLEVLNIELYKSDLSLYKVRGFFRLKEDGTSQICYDIHLTNPQIRYTVMHEIAHKLLLDYVSGHFLSEEERNGLKNLVYDLVRTDSINLQKHDAIENMCDDFAINALMPSDILQEFRGRHGGVVNSWMIADYFGVEEELVESYKNNIKGQ